MATLSNIKVGVTTHEFLFQAMGINQSIPADSSFDVDLPNYTAEIVNVEGFVRKKISVAGMLISDAGGDSATVKMFSLANFLRLNSHLSLTMTIQLDGGLLIKQYIGKYVGSLITGVTSSRPLDLQFSFDFIIESSSW